MPTCSGCRRWTALQERSSLLDQTAVVADALGAAHWRFVPSLHGTPGPSPTWTTATEDDGALTEGPTYGVGLVSRLPVREWHVRRFAPAPVAMPLMVPGVKGLTRIPDEPRVALAAVLDGPRGPMTVVTAHLSFVPGWNVAQLRALTRWALALPGPRLLVGDFNLPGAVARMVSRWVQLARWRRTRRTGRACSSTTSSRTGSRSRRCATCRRCGCRSPTTARCASTSAL